MHQRDKGHGGGCLGGGPGGKGRLSQTSCRPLGGAGGAGQQGRKQDGEGEGQPPPRPWSRASTAVFLPGQENHEKNINNGIFMNFSES